MAVRSVLIWSCSYCPAVAEKEGYGFPPGWGHAFRLRGGPILHFCPDCGKQHDLKDGKVATVEP